MVKYIFIILPFLLAGCADKSKLIESSPTTTAKVVVPIQCPKPSELNRPDLEVLSLINESSSDGEVVRAYRVALTDIKGYAKELEKILQGYKEACSKTTSQENNHQ